MLNFMAMGQLVGDQLGIASLSVMSLVKAKCSPLNFLDELANKEEVQVDRTPGSIGKVYIMVIVLHAVCCLSFCCYHVGVEHVQSVYVIHMPAVFSPTPMTYPNQLQLQQWQELSSVSPGIYVYVCPRFPCCLLSLNSC